MPARLLPAHDLDPSSASTRDRFHRRSRHSGGSPAHPGWRRIGAAARRKWPRLPAACSRCAAPAEPRASLLERCCRVSDNRREPFRSRRQACRFGPMESSDRWRTIPKLRSPRWRRSVNSPVSGSTWSRPSRSPRPAGYRCHRSGAGGNARRSMSRPPAVLRQGGDLQGRLSSRQDVPGSPRRRGEPFERRRHGCGSKWPDRQLPTIVSRPALLCWRSFRRRAPWFDITTVFLTAITIGVKRKCRARVRDKSPFAQHAADVFPRHARHGGEITVADP